MLFRSVNQAHSVLGERPAYVGVNGWHDPGRSDGLSKLENSMRDVVKRWTMQDTNYFSVDKILYARFTWTVMILVRILSFYVIVTGAGSVQAWSIFHAFDFSSIYRATWSSLC